MNHQPLTDLQWQVLESFFPKQAKRSRGKPHTPWRAVLNSILFVLTTRSKWESLPKTPEYASKSAAHRWYKEWKKSGFIEPILQSLKGMKESSFELVHPPTRHRMPKAPEIVHEVIAATV